MFIYFKLYNLGLVDARVDENVCNPTLTTAKCITRGVGRGDIDPRILAGSIPVLTGEIDEIKRNMKGANP